MMRHKLSKIFLLLSFLILAGCGGQPTTYWAHTTASKYSFKIDRDACMEIAYKEVPPPPELEQKLYLIEKESDLTPEMSGVLDEWRSSVKSTFDSCFKKMGYFKQ